VEEWQGGIGKNTFQPVEALKENNEKVMLSVLYICILFKCKKYIAICLAA
jgi:transcription initiation factor IIE alpha subunit